MSNHNINPVAGKWRDDDFKDLLGRFDDHPQLKHALTIEVVEYVQQLKPFEWDMSIHEKLQWFREVETQATSLNLGDVGTTQFALYCFKGEASKWAWSFMKNTPIWPVWKDFKVIVSERFASKRTFIDCLIRLTLVRYENSIEEYNSEFCILCDDLANMCPIPEGMAILKYRSGLPQEYQRILEQNINVEQTLDDHMRFMSDHEISVETRPDPSDRFTHPRLLHGGNESHIEATRTTILNKFETRDDYDSAVPLNFTSTTPQSTPHRHLTKRHRVKDLKKVNLSKNSRSLEKKLHALKKRPAKAPPYPCTFCNGDHWNADCPTKGREKNSKPVINSL